MRGSVRHLSPPVRTANLEMLTRVRIHLRRTLQIAAVAAATTLLRKRVMLRADGTNCLTVARGGRARCRRQCFGAELDAIKTHLWLSVCSQRTAAGC